MRLLIITQKVNKNDDILGFFHGWILEFAKYYEKVTVICLEKGEYDLPENVKVLSLGKERNYEGRVGHPVAERSVAGVSDTSRIISKLKYTLNFYKYIWQERKNYDKVFVHMNPIYVVLGGLFWRLRKNKIALWYTHRNVDLKLKIAEKLTNVIFSASPESFQMKTQKLKVVGHGVDAYKLNCKNFVGEKEFDIVCVGRISPIKNQKILIEAVNILVNERNLKDLKLAIVGSGILEKDNTYFKEVEKFVEENNLQNNIIFVGSVSNEKISSYYCRSKISVNLCPTGGMDKVVLEAMSCEILSVAFNKTFESMLSNKGLILKNLDKNELAEKILKFLQIDESKRKNLGSQLRQIVVENHSLSGLITKIKESF